MVVLVGFLSCSKPDSPAAVQVVDPISRLESEAPELDFYGLPKKSATNIEVGDYVKVKLRITKLNGANLIVAAPVGKSATFHDLLNTDYEMYLASSSEPGKYLKVESLNLQLGENVFYIKPIVAGTFQLQLEEITKTFILKDPIIFNAVKITTSTTTGTDGNCGLKRWRHRDFYFSIDAGNQIYDNYLTDSKAAFGYSTSYDGASLQDVFAPKTNLKIIPTRNQCGDNPGVPGGGATIELFKTINGNKQIIAVYYGVAVN